MISGSHPATAILLILANGSRSFLSAYSSLQMSVAEAPSVNGEDVPAVTEPFSSKAGFRSAKLSTAGLSANDLDVIELNEAFASQSIACIQDLQLDLTKINIDGGAIALGHPLGATGARITGKAAALLKREGGNYALSTQCIGGGQGIATILGNDISVFGPFRNDIK